MAAEHLLSLGHRRLAFIGGLPTFTAAGPRLAGFRAACRAAKLDPDSMPVLPGDGSFEGGERATSTLLAEHPDVTGVVCYNDLEAIGVMRALRAVGRRVPVDLSVIGCDDIAAASWVTPALTTVGQQTAVMGRLAVERLLHMLDEPALRATNDVLRLPMRLIVRESTATAPGARP
jgi:LacI family transcriptional regulator